MAKRQYYKTSRHSWNKHSILPYINMGKNGKTEIHCILIISHAYSGNRDFYLHNYLPLILFLVKNKQTTKKNLKDNDQEIIRTMLKLIYFFTFCWRYPIPSNWWDSDDNILVGKKFKKLVQIVYIWNSLWLLNLQYNVKLWLLDNFNIDF